MTRVMDLLNKVSGLAIIRQARGVKEQVDRLSDLLDDINKLDNDMNKGKSNGVHKPIR